jgi:hypothetical protein
MVGACDSCEADDMACMKIRHTTGALAVTTISVLKVWNSLQLVVFLLDPSYPLAK